MQICFAPASRSLREGSAASQTSPVYFPWKARLLQISCQQRAVLQLNGIGQPARRPKRLHTELQPHRIHGKNVVWTCSVSFRSFWMFNTFWMFNNNSLLLFSVLHVQVQFLSESGGSTRGPSRSSTFKSFRMVFSNAFWHGWSKGFWRMPPLILHDVSNEYLNFET